MSRRTLDLHTLEARLTPAITGAGGMYSDALGYLPWWQQSDIRFNTYTLNQIDVRVSGGTLFITGTPLDDRVELSNDSDVYATNSAQGTRYTSVDSGSYSRVEFNGGGGSDTFVSQSLVKPVLARGGDGGDSLTGGWVSDTLIGDMSEDLLIGRGGNDVIWGDGAGQISGYAPDGANGSTMKDTIRGDEGDDYLFGGFGADTVSGGANNDLVNGGDGDDVLNGDAGNDTLGSYYGTGYENGDDELLGGPDADTLNAGAGDDMLFGGLGLNWLTGGADDDRFLTWSAADDRVTDRWSNDARAQFNDTTAVTNRDSNEVDPATGNPITAPLRYAAASWTEAEILMVDGGLEWAHKLTANTRFLKPSDPTAQQVFVREGAYVAWTAAEATNNVARQVANDRGPQYIGWNGSTGIAHNTAGINAGAESVQETTVHELAHNWATASNEWTNWQNQSGWRNTAPAAAEMNQFTRSGDGRWWFRNTANGTFYRALVNANDTYSTFNPMEDWTTAWEGYRLWKLGRLDATIATAMANKFAIIDRFVTWMRQT